MNQEIVYNVVNAIIAGALVFAGAMSDGSITETGLIMAAGASCLVALTSFKEYWTSKRTDFTTKPMLFKFL